ncbi:hypothetical protein B566_EDAN008668 [Ephemera danica]|nr:hypothetical protein B566_EDAN008668 [Ephemera danica]
MTARSPETLWCIAVMILLAVTATVDSGISGHPSTFILDGESLLMEPEEPTQILDRHRRYLLYRPMSLLQFTYAYAMPVELMPRRMLIIVLGGQIAYEMPFNLSQLTVQDIAARRKLDDVAMPNVLRAAEIMMDQKGIPGRSCLLLAVCQLAETPLERDMGLLEDLIHLLLTPSENSHPDDWVNKEEQRQYMEAEEIGKNGTMDCRSMYPQCNVSIMDAFSRIMLT